MRVTKPEKCEKSLSYQNNPSYLNIQRTNPHSFFTINNSPLFIITNSGLRHIELNLHFILYPPVTQLPPAANRQNGEFGAGHTRTANLPRLTAAKRIPQTRLICSILLIKPELNVQQHIKPADNVTAACRQQSERRIYDGFQPFSRLRF